MAKNRPFYRVEISPFGPRVLGRGLLGRSSRMGPDSGTTLNVIRAVLPKFEERNSKLDAYTVSVFERDASYIVILKAPDL